MTEEPELIPMPEPEEVGVPVAVPLPDPEPESEPMARTAADIEQLTTDAPRVAIVVSDRADLLILERCETVLEARGVSCEVRVISADEEPRAVADYTDNAQLRGICVIIAGAGPAARLPMMITTHAGDRSPVVQSGRPERPGRSAPGESGPRRRTGRLGRAGRRCQRRGARGADPGRGRVSDAVVAALGGDDCERSGDAGLRDVLDVLSDHGGVAASGAGRAGRGGRGGDEKWVLGVRHDGPPRIVVVRCLPYDSA
jgi:hypothetical protein